MKFHVTYWLFHSMDISIDIVALHLMHSTRFLSSILRSVVPNGKKRKFLSSFVLELLRKQSHAQTPWKRHIL
jgi:hypothetical protein